MLTETCKHLRCEHFSSDTGGARCTALQCPHEDDKPIYNEAMDSIASLRAALAAERSAREKAEKKAEIISHSSLGNNLCPDHRDKQAGKPCLACEIEKKEKEIALEKRTADGFGRLIKAYQIELEDYAVNMERANIQITALKAENEGLLNIIGKYNPYDKVFDTDALQAGKEANHANL